MTVTATPSQATAITLVAGTVVGERGVTIENTDANPLFILLGDETPTTSLYTKKLATDGYYEVPFGYTGPIKGIWGADGAGFAMVTVVD